MLQIEQRKGVIVKALTMIVWLLAFSITLPAQTYDEKVEAYINRYKEIAITEMQRTGIPASITLAQGIIESNAGQSPLAMEANNHFGIKCHAGWMGASYIYDDDRKNECFRKYDSSLVSYKDHSDFLRNRERYAILFTYDTRDYTSWAKGLKACGYATNPQYANILIKCINDYDLHQWDLAPEERSAWFASLNRTGEITTIKETGNPEVINAQPTAMNVTERIYVFNDIDCVTLFEGETLNDLATAFALSLKRLMRYNDITEVSQIATGDRVFLQPKRQNGDVALHTVKEGETMFSISRDHGIQLARLYEKNLMKPGTEPKAGETLNLKELRKTAPALVNDEKGSLVKSVNSPVMESPAAGQVHVVSKGDTLYSISKKYNVTVTELKTINKLNSTDLQIGEKLVVAK